MPNALIQRSPRRTARFFVLLLVCGLLLAPAAAFAQQKVLTREGTFVGMETGDLTYLVIETNGKKLAYVCDAPIIDAVTGVKPTLPIFVTYALQTEYNEGAGENVTYEVVKSVFIPDEYTPNYGIRIEAASKPGAQ